MTSAPDDGAAVATAQQNLAVTVGRLVVTAKEQAVSAICDVAQQLRQSAQQTSESVALDIERVSNSIASGIRNIKGELSVPQSVKDHPGISLIAAVAISASAVVVVASLTRVASPIVARRGVRGLGGALSMLALDVGISLWMSRLQAKKLSAATEAATATIH